MWKILINNDRDDTLITLKPRFDTIEAAYEYIQAIFDITGYEFNPLPCYIEKSYSMYLEDIFIVIERITE